MLLWKIFLFEETQETYNKEYYIVFRETFQDKKYICCY